MYTRFFIYLFIQFAVFSKSCFAQEIDAKSTFTSNQLKWELGYDPISWIVTSGASGANSLIVRKYIYKDNKIRALRAKFYYRGNNIIRNDSRSSSIPASDGSGYNNDLRIFLGKEWNKQFGRIAVFYGSDVMLRLFDNVNKTYNISGKLTTITSSNSYEIGLSPLIGSKYMLASMFSISVETSLLALYHNGRTVTKNNLDTLQPFDISGNVENFSVSFFPITGIYFGFHF